MAPNATPGSRKRGRPRNDKSDNSTSAKKPRLTSSAATNKTTPGSLRSLSSKPFGSGQRKAPRIGSLGKGKQSIDNNADENEQTTRGNRSISASKSLARGSTPDINGVYEFHGSDEEPSPAQTLSGRGRAATSTGQNTPKTSESSFLTAKKTISMASSKPAPQVAGHGTKRIASRANSRKVGRNDEQAEASEDGKDEAEEISDSNDVLNTPSSVRTSIKSGATLHKINGTTSKLKGILTPSRRLSERNVKSVLFDEPNQKNDEIFFADLPNKSAKSKSTSQTRPAGKENKSLANTERSESETLEEEEEVCVICSKPDSIRPNQILFCDGCDMAVHQQCYGVARIPKEEWLCRDCSQLHRESTDVMEEKASMGASEVMPNIPNFEQHLRSFQRILLDRCTGKRRIKLCGQDEAYEKTFQLVNQTVMAGEGNSMLIIGARGCGKTTMIDSVLSDIGLEHKSEFHVVRLNGFIHTDDKLALKDIWRQLGKEMDVEDDLIGKTNNYADTLASLLALLSHPSEIATTQEGLTSRSVIFIIDEFDLFATHARQTLLYNLFDIAQARKAPIAVLGLTNRIDVVESLEKRVKSRFSHRYVYMSLPKTFREYWEICKQGLVIDDEDAKSEGLDITRKGFTQFHDYWTKKIDTLYKDQLFKDHIEYYYYSSKSVPAFLNSCVLPLAILSPTDMNLRLNPAQDRVFGTDAPDSKLHLLGSLSDLDLSLLISAARLDIVAHTDTVNFAMAYDEYTTLIGRQRVQSSTSGMLALGGGVRVWGRGVAEIAWERLVLLGLLLPTGMGGRYGGLESRMWKVDVTLEEIPVAVKLNTVLARWCKEI